MAEILNEPDLERTVESFTLVPSDGGRFEFSANGKLLYSKLETGKHVEEGQLKQLLENYLAG
jgi:selT/selW/selH-like putative selenoprotein